MPSVVFEGLHAFERFSHFTERLAVAVDAPFIIAAEATSHVLHENVKKVHGSHKLRDLEQSTQAERVALGYSANDPLVRTGELLRDHVERFHEGMVAAAGSAEPIAAYHEYGFFNVRANRWIAPRPAFEIGLHDTEAEAGVFLSEAVGAALGFGYLRP